MDLRKVESLFPLRLEMKLRLNCKRLFCQLFSSYYKLLHNENTHTYSLNINTVTEYSLT